MNIRYKIIYWRDIPAQIKIRNGRERMSKALPPRFQETINRAAFRAKAISGDAYLEAWRSTGWVEREGDAHAIAGELLQELEARYDSDKLDQLARNKGYDSKTN